MRRENKRVEFRKSKKLKFSTFRILKIINDKSFSTDLNSFQPMIQNHSKNHWFLMILNYFEQLNRAGNSSRKIKIIKMSNKIFRHLVQSFPPGFHESSDRMVVHENISTRKHVRQDFGPRFRGPLAEHHPVALVRANFLVRRALLVIAFFRQQKTRNGKQLTILNIFEQRLLV